MYVPEHFRANDEAVVELLENHGAADLITATSDGLVATHLPFVFDSATGGLGALFGHVARANAQWRLGALGEALVIVRGPEAYVSPSFYPSKAEDGRVVPTWNYLTAHVYGELVVHDDVRWTEALVRQLTTKHESLRDAPWSVDDAPESFIAAQLRAIVGLEVRIMRIEAKAKWSQNRSETDREGVAAGLEESGPREAASAARHFGGS
jgi:transcriptional regulator